MKTFSLLLVGCAILSTVGCAGGGAEGELPTFPTKVTVTYKGAPVEGATIAFINETAPAYGRTDASGVAMMKTYKEGDGAIVKIHNVTIVKTNILGAASDADQDSPDYDPATANANLKIEYLIPQRYSSPGTSKLVAEITDQKLNELTFDLTDK